MEVRWSPEAADDLERIGRRILRDKPLAARNIVLTLYRGISDLRSFPNRGRSGTNRRHAGADLSFTAYIAVYRRRNESVEVVRIYHAAQDWP